MGDALQAVGHMNLVAQLIGIGVADLGAPGEAELLTRLLSDIHAGNGARAEPSHSANSSG